MKTRFEHGDLARIAKEAGLSKQFLNNVLKGRRKLRSSQAEALVVAATTFGFTTNVFDWLFPSQTENPLFAKWKG